MKTRSKIISTKVLDRTPGEYDKAYGYYRPKIQNNSVKILELLN